MEGQYNGTYFNGDPLQSFDQRSEPAEIVRVLCSMYGCQCVASRLPLVSDRVCTILGAADIGEQSIVHNVTTQKCPGFESLATEVFHAGCGWAKQQITDMVGDNPIDFFRHIPVEAAKTSLDVSKAQLQFCCGQSPRRGRIRIAIKQYPIRTFGLEYRLKAPHHLRCLFPVSAGTDPQVVCRLRYAQVPEEGAAHSIIVMLPSMDDTMLDSVEFGH